MAQITLYIDAATQARLRDAAALRKQSQSQFVADLIRKATVSDWLPQVLLSRALPQSVLIAVALFFRVQRSGRTPSGLRPAYHVPAPAAFVCVHPAARVPRRPAPSFR